MLMQRPTTDFFCNSCNRRHKPHLWGATVKHSHGTKSICIDAQKRIESANASNALKYRKKLPKHAENYLVSCNG